MRPIGTRQFRICALLSAATSATLALAALFAPVSVHYAAFTAENDHAMARMMAAMHSAPSGNIDRDFALMMIPHHQGAIDMAQAELRYGSDPQLRRLAQEIIVEQTQEIRVMQLALDSLPPASSSSSQRGHLVPANKRPAGDDGTTVAH